MSVCYYKQITESDSYSTLPLTGSSKSRTADAAIGGAIGGTIGGFLVFIIFVLLVVLVLFHIKCSKRRKKYTTNVGSRLNEGIVINSLVCSITTYV